MHKITITSEWTLFLDRDGVINRRIDGAYVSNLEEFEFLPQVLESLAIFSRMFAHLIIVTNQQGIGKGILTPEQLDNVHQNMLDKIAESGGCVDAVYYCAELAQQTNNCRKPSPVLAIRAQEDYHDIDFHKSIIVGDSISDVEFGQNLGMKTVLVGEQLGYPGEDKNIVPDFILPDLAAVVSILT